jgi:hypothetical protein
MKGKSWYQKGDNVVVRNDLVYSIEYDHTCYVVHSMAKYFGKVVTISEVRKSISDSDYYKIVEDDHAFNWTNTMFDGLVKDEYFTVDL